MSMGDFDRQPLDEFEEVRGVYYGKYGEVGQQYVVTNRRLLLAPIRLINRLSDKVALDIAAYLAGALNVPGVDLVKSILQDYGPFKPTTIWLRHIVSVEPGSNGSWRTPPQIVLTLVTDETESLGVSRKGKGWWKLFILNSDSHNRGLRDAMVEVLRKAVPEAKARPAPDAAT